MGEYRCLQVEERHVRGKIPLISFLIRANGSDSRVLHEISHKEHEAHIAPYTIPSSIYGLSYYIKT